MRYAPRSLAFLALSTVAAACTAPAGEADNTGETSEAALTAGAFSSIWVRSLGGGDSDGIDAAAQTTDGRLVTVGSFDPSFQEVGGLGGPKTHFGGEPCLHIASFDANGAHLWSRFPVIGRIPEVPVLSADRAAVFPNAAMQFVRAAAGGDVIVGGWYHSAAIDLGTGLLRAPDRASISQPGDYTEIFVARFGPHGEPRWAKAFGGAGYRSLRGLSVAPDGSIVLAAEVTKVASFGGAPVLVPPGVGSGTALARLDGNGAHVATKLFSKLVPVGVGVTSNGDVMLAGNANSELSLDASRAAYHRSVVLARLDASFAVRWAKGFDVPSRDASPESSANSVQVAPSGDTVIAGHYDHSFTFHRPNFGGGELSGDSTSFVAAFDPAGGHRYSFGFDGNAKVLSASPGGSAFVAGQMSLRGLGLGGQLALSLDAAGHVRRATNLGTTLDLTAIVPLADGTDIFAGAVGFNVHGHGYGDEPIPGAPAKPESNLFLARTRLR